MYCECKRFSSQLRGDKRCWFTRLCDGDNGFTCLQYILHVESVENFMNDIV